MKQVFVVEIDSSDYVHAVTENDLSNMLTQGFYSARMVICRFAQSKKLPWNKLVERPKVLKKKLLACSNEQRKAERIQGRTRWRLQ